MPNPMPGPYEVSQTIQAILQRRRDEARQAMLDKLQEEQVRTTMSNAQRQLQLEAERNTLEGRRVAADEAQSQQQIKESKERTFGEQLKTLPYAGVKAEDIRNQDLRQEMYGRAMFEQQQPQGPTEEGGTLPSFDWYRGDPEYQKERSRRADIQGLPDTPTWRDLASVGFNPSGMLPSPKVPLTVLRPGKKPERYEDFLVPESQSVAQEGWQPAAYFGGASALRPMGAVMHNPSTGETQTVSGPAGQIMPQIDVLESQGWQLVNWTGTGTPRTQGVAATLVAKLALAKGRADALKEARLANNSPFWPGAPQPTEAELAYTKEYESLKAQLDASDTATPELKSIAIELMSDPANQGVSPAQLVTQVEGEDGMPLTLSEQRDLLRLLSR